MKFAYVTVAEVNRAVNQDIRYRADILVHKTPEFWQAAINEGDCEDYALEKRRRLLALGADMQDLSLATAHTETNEYHAVLIVKTDRGDFVLDNRYPEPMARQELAYRWDKIEDEGKWSSVV